MFLILQPNLVSRTKNMQKIIIIFFLSCVELVKPGGFSLNKLFKLLLLSVRAVHGQVFSKRCSWCLGWARLPHLPLPSRCGYFALTHPPPSCLAHPASWWAQCWLTGSTLQTMAQQWRVLSCRLSSRDLRGGGNEVVLQLQAKAVNPYSSLTAYRGAEGSAPEGR